MHNLTWLSFSYLRGVALIHKLPPILKPDILFPWHSASEDTTQVLPSFLKLIQLFWIFDQSGIIDLLRNAESSPFLNLYSPPFVSTCLGVLQPKLQQLVTDSDWGSGTDEQRADVFLTRQWMRAILWRAALRFGVADLAAASVDPVGIAREFLSLTARVPAAALESHGAALVSHMNDRSRSMGLSLLTPFRQEFKTFEIATAVLDAIAGNLCLGFSLDYVAATLFSLQDLLSSFRGGKNKLRPILEAKMQSILGVGDPGRPLNLDGEQQTAVTELDVEESREPGHNTTQNEELLTSLPVCGLSRDGTTFPREDAGILGFLDLPSLLTNNRPSTKVVQTEGEQLPPGDWTLDYDTIGGGAFGQL